MAPPLDRARASKAYRQYPSAITVGTWTVAEVQDAVRDHELGMFQKSALLADAMGRNDRIVSALDTLILGILRLPFQVSPARVRAGRRASFVAEELAAVWPHAVPDDELYEAIRWVVMLGFALVELIWNTDDPERWVPDRIRVWHPQFIYWREDRRVFVVQTADGPVEVDPEDLGGKWLLIAPGGERSWMRGAVRSLADDFVAITDAERDWLRHSEVHGGGIMKAKTPAGVGDEKDHTRFVNSVANMGSEPVIECPTDKDGTGYDLEILETGKDHAAGFKALLDHLTANVNVRILGQNASTENAGPYVAKGGLFAKVTLDRIDGIVGPLEYALRFHLARPFAAWNYGDEALAPVPAYDSEPPPDKKAQADTMAQLAIAANTLKSAGLVIDPVELSERFGFKVEAEAKTPGGAQFFAYDLAEGVVTINEYRASKGLPPVPWGDQTAPERKAELERELEAAKIAAAKPAATPEEAA